MSISRTNITKHLLFVLAFITVYSCDFHSSDKLQEQYENYMSEGVITLKIYEKGLFSTVKASAKGDYMSQKMGDLKTVINLIAPNTPITIIDEDLDKIYNLKIDRYPSNQITDLQEEVLNYMAEKVGFNWKFEEILSDAYSVSISNKSLLQKAKNGLTGTRSLKSISNREIRCVDTLHEIFDVLEDNMFNYPVIIESDLDDTVYDITVPKEDYQTVREHLLEEYGIELSKTKRKVKQLKIVME